ncbi:virulence-associated E family protein [Sphingomonas sp. CFBP 13728]|uniref:VapE domain-containing protein n=1 Tax=Sphingomonas sp. CFBP 13728 TaxID=2775294 RepID=UPI0017824498|nr:VapE domain-containing protein [Sphingomonas sp. CFBP 13728]MBD8619266.1 virulence-associated E family protein [Sphingomonas sp. CFBP 13728]
MQRNTNVIGPFPDRPAPRSDRPPATIANVDHLLKHAGIKVRYNEVSKRDEVTVPGRTGSNDNIDNVTLAYIVSLGAEHHMPTGNIPGFVEVIANRDAYNPMRDWIRSVPWDGVDRMAEVFATVTAQPDYPNNLKEVLLQKWLRSIAAAATREGFRSRGVLTLQGAQGMGKSSWIKALISDTALADSVVKLGHHMDASNKDSVIGAICYAIVELGELDSSFKKDLARLKGFLTDDHDRVRRPYDRREASYPRRTVFAATVNEHQFLQDPTGNTRFWTIPVTKLDYTHTINMQQVFAQLAAEVEAGEIWWLQDNEEGLLDELNSLHASVSPVAEKLADAIDHTRIGADGLPALSATDVAEKLGFPTTVPSAREAGAALRALLGPPKKIQGTMKWRVPWVEVDGEAMVPDHVKAARARAQVEDKY